MFKLLCLLAPIVAVVATPAFVPSSSLATRDILQLPLKDSSSQNIQHLDEETKKPFIRHIVAVGDLHGDYLAALHMLKHADVIDETGNWTGQTDILVQTGDLVDRGDDTLKLFLGMDVIRRQAENKGGVLINLLGNHEWMNALGDWRDVAETELATFGSVPARQKAISTGFIGSSWEKYYKNAARVPLHASLGPPNTDYSPFDEGAVNYTENPLSFAAISFVHAGLSPTYPGLTPFPSFINDLGSNLLFTVQHGVQRPPYPPWDIRPKLPQNSTQEEEDFWGNDGPLWYRGWALDPDEEVCSKVDNVLAKTGTRRMVMGHTVSESKRIKSRCGGKIILIDTGMSHVHHGALSALSIRYSLTPLRGTGSNTVWNEREVVTAMYPHEFPTEVLVDETREIVGDFGI